MTAQRLQESAAGSYTGACLFLGCGKALDSGVQWTAAEPPVIESLPKSVPQHSQMVGDVLGRSVLPEGPLHELFEVGLLTVETELALARQLEVPCCRMADFDLGKTCQFQYFRHAVLGTAMT